MKNKWFSRVLSLLLTLMIVLPIMSISILAEDSSVVTTEPNTTLVNGITISVDENGTLVESDGDVTVSVYHVRLSVTSTITIENTTSASAIISFDYAASNYAENGWSLSSDAIGTYEKMLAVGEKATFSLTNVATQTATVVLSNIKATKPAENATITVVYDQTLGSVTAGDVTGENGQIVVNNVGESGVTMTATPNSGVTFTGWAEKATGKVLSKDLTYTHIPTGDVTIEAIFTRPEDPAKFTVGSGTALLSLTDALTQAESNSSYNNGKLVTLAVSGVLEEGTYTIPNGVKLLIPYADGDKGTFGSEPAGSTETPGSSQSAFRTLKLMPGAVLKFDSGSMLNVNGCVYQKNGNYSGVCTGAYGCIELSAGAKINMNSGSKLYCYGYIIGDGEVVANSGATVYEVFQMNGWRGGTITEKWMDASVSSFAFSDYAIQNIESDFVVNYGATAMVTATITVNGGDWLGMQSKTAVTEYIDKYENSKGLLQLESDTAIRRSFTPATNRMKYTIYDINTENSTQGKAHIASIDISVDLGWFGNFSLNTAKYILAIPYYMDFVAAEGSTVTLNNNYKLLPGASLTVEEGATAIVKKNLYIYDTADYVGKGYVSGNSIPVRYVATTGATAGSLPKMNSGTPSGRVIVNGTLQIDGAIFTTANGGTSVDKAITGTGKIVNNSSKTADDIGLDEYGYVDSAIVDYPVAVVPAVGRLTGISGEDSYDSFASGNYTGLGDGWWYQRTVSFSGSLAKLKSNDGSLIIVNDGTATGYSCNGGMLKFTLPFAYSASCENGNMTCAAAAGGAMMVYSVPVSADGIEINITEDSTEANNATIKYVSKADGSIVDSQECYIPVGTDVSAYYADQACSSKASVFASGDILYILAEAKVGEDAYYASLEDAIKNADNVGDVVTLLSDIEITSPIKVSAEQDIDVCLAGKTVTYSSNAFVISGIVDMDFQGGTMTNAQGAEVSALIVRNGGTLNLTLSGGELTWSDYGVEGYSFSSTLPASLIHCYSGGVANINIAEGETFSVVHPNAVTTYTLHAVINEGTMTINGAGTITSDAYTATTGAYVNAGSDTYNAAPPVVNRGTMRIQGTTVSFTNTNGSKNYAILNYDGGKLTLDGATVSSASGYVIYNWGGTITSIKDTVITGAQGICNYNMNGYSYTATISEIVGTTTIEATGGYALSTHPETYVGVIGGAGSDVELIASGNAINGNEGFIKELGEGLTIISTGGYGVYTKGVVEKVSVGGYYKTGNSVFYADTGTAETPYNASIGIPEGYHLSIMAQMRKLRNGKVYGCSYLTTEEQKYPQILAGHLQALPDINCQGPDLWQALIPEFGYYTDTAWSTAQATVYSITIPVQTGDRISASSFGTTLKADGTDSAGIRVTWFDENGIMASWASGTTYSKNSANGYITVPDGAIAVCIPVWVGEWEGNEAYLVKDCVYEYVDEDSDGFYTAVCSGCGTAHEGLLEHLQVPADYCRETNLWTTLKPELSRRTASAWQNDYYSITFPVEAGDKIWASSFQAAGANDHTANGIRVTWFHNTGKVTSFDSNTVYTEFSGNTDETTGLNYITAPESAIAICVTMWKNNSNSDVRVLNKAHTYENTVTPPTCKDAGYTTHTCSICNNTYQDSETAATGEHKFTKYVSNGDATAETNGTKTATCDYGCGAENTIEDEGSKSVYEALQGKVISIMGDSISTMEGYIPEADGFNLQHYARYVLTAKEDTSYIVMDPAETWWMQVINEFDAKLGINESWRSTEIGNIFDVEVNSGYEGTKACMASMTRIQNLGSNGTPDLILFYGGTNDITQRNNANPRVLGSFNESLVPAEVDLTTDKWDTVIEAYITALMRMHHFYPDTRIVCMFPTVTSKNTASVVSTYNAEFKKACDYFIAQGYDIVYVDLLDSGVTTAHLADGTHPNEEGMDLITAAVKKTLLDSCGDMTVGENTVYTVEHSLTNVKASHSYYKGASNGKPFVEILNGEDINVTVTMGGEDVTETVYNAETGVISISAVTGAVKVTAEGTYDPTELYADRLQQIPEGICCGVNLLERLYLNSGYFKDGAWDTSKYYSLTIAVEEGVKLWATSFQARNLNGATGTDGVRITWFKNDGSYQDYEADDVYSEFSANGYITVPADVAAVSIILRNDNADNAVYVMSLAHDGDYVDNGNGTETMSCTKCNKTETRVIGQYLIPYIQMLPENVYNTTNLWPLLEHNTKYYKSSDTTESTLAYDAATWGTNGAVRAVAIPVGSGYRIYASSLTRSTGIRITWFFKDQTALSWNPAQSRAYFLANTDESTGLHYIAAPEGAIAVNVAMWDDSETNKLYILNLPVDPLTLNGLPEHLVELPDPCYNDTNIWAELKEAGKLDGKYWNGTTWGTTGTAKSVTIRVNPGDKIVASSFGTTSGGNGIRVSWFLSDGTVDSRPPRSGEGNVYEEFTKNGYLTAPENAIAVCIPMWADDDTCYIYNLSLPENPLKASGVLDHLVDLPDPCYKDTNIWAELYAAGKLDDMYYTATGWGTLEGAKSITIPVKPGDRIDAYSFGTSNGKNGIRVTWFFADGSVSTLASDKIYDEYIKNGYLTAPANAIAVCIPMWAVTDECYVYNLDLPTRPLSGVENYNGKVISIMGDSISTFAGYTPVADGFNLAHRNRYPQSNLSMDVNETWWMQVLTELNAKLGINDSWAGSRVNNTSDANSGDIGPDAAMASITRIKNLGANGTPDVILVFGGTNDRSSTLGSFDAATAPTVENVDLTSYKWDNFVDAYVAMITRMKYYYPDAEIIALLPYMPNAASMNVEIKKICEHYGVAYTDLMDCGIKITTEHLPDNLHPNADGFDCITDAVLDVLLNEVEMTAGENVVYPITHELTNVEASNHYYKGVSADTKFEETLTVKTGMTVTVTMNGEDITATAYDEETGVISIDSVTGAIEITAIAEKTNSEHVQSLPDPAYRDTNLWAKLEPENAYYDANGWKEGLYSITFPVNGGDKIWSTSLCDGTINGSGNDGICITWFKGDEVLKRLPRTEADAEFKAYGYVTAPEGATAVNVPTWSTSITNVVYNLSLPTIYDGHLIELNREDICSGIDIWNLLESDWEDVYLDSAGKWTEMDGLRSITIPVNVGDKIWASAFATTTMADGTSKTGIRITWLGENGILSTVYVSKAQGTLSDDGTVTVPEGAIAVNLPVWDYMVENDIYILNIEHSYTSLVTTEPTCTEAGAKTYTCSCGDTYTEEIKALGHTEVVDAAVAATCTVAGKTEGKHCSVCNEVLVAQTEVAALGHTEVVDAAVEPTCTATGKTEGKHCSVCDEVLVAQEVVDALGHTWTDATCTAPKTCSVCSATEGEALGHTWKEATCTAPKTCSVCNATEGEALGHTWTDATCTIPKTCSVCDATEGDKTGHTEVVDAAVAATCTATGLTEGKHCSVCNEVLVAQTEVAALGHTEVIDAAVEATCTVAGKTEGKHCSVCNKVLVAQEEVPATGEHTYVDGTCTGCGAEDSEVEEDFVPTIGNGTTAGTVGENGSVTVTYGVTEITVAAPVTGWQIGENTFTVASTNDIACVVLVKKADGGYDRIPASMVDGKHSFTATLAVGDQIVVAIKGDANTDGFINATDYGQALTVALGNASFTEMKKYFADVTKDGNINATDYGQILTVALGNGKFSW